MPVIAEHHARDEWRPKQPWPTDCHVQWGGSGVVLGSAPYRTAFFEAFPRDGTAGFIRGEGPSIDDAEADAFRQWSASSACLSSGGHRWTRSRRTKGKDGKPKAFTYTNGGCFCLKCGAFQTAMLPIVELGSWRKPLSCTELETIASGYCRPRHGDPDDQRKALWRRRTALRGTAAGIKLPPLDMPCTPKVGVFDPDEYETACRRAVADYYLANLEAIEAAQSGTGMMGLFDGLSIRFLRSLAEEVAEGKAA